MSGFFLWDHNTICFSFIREICHAFPHKCCTKCTRVSAKHNSDYYEWEWIPPCPFLVTIGTGTVHVVVYLYSCTPNIMNWKARKKRHTFSVLMRDQVRIFTSCNIYPNWEYGKKRHNCSDSIRHWARPRMKSHAFVSTNMSVQLVYCMFITSEGEASPHEVLSLLKVVV